MVKSNLKRFSYLLNSQIIRDFKITLGTAIGLMILNKFSFSYIIPDYYLNIIWLIISLIALVLVIFLFSLLTRSFGIKGGILGAIIGCSLIFVYYILPSIMQLYSVERFFWMIGISIVYIIIGWFGSNYLLKNKVHV